MGHALKGRHKIGSTDRGGAAAARGRWLRQLRWLLVLPFLMLSLLTPGTMLTQDAQGGVMVVLCAGDGPVEMMLAPDGSLHDKSAADPHQRCDWAPHAQPAIAQPAAALPVLVRLALPRGFQLAPPDRLRRAEILAPSARGPPAFV